MCRILTIGIEKMQ